jgi:glycosyltransferase involved in cell wall biosynthesis
MGSVVLVRLDLEAPVAQLGLDPVDLAGHHAAGPDRRGLDLEHATRRVEHIDIGGGEGPRPHPTSGRRTATLMMAALTVETPQIGGDAFDRRPEGHGSALPTGDPSPESRRANDGGSHQRRQEERHSEQHNGHRFTSLVTPAGELKGALVTKGTVASRRDGAARGSASGHARRRVPGWPEPTYGPPRTSVVRIAIIAPPWVPVPPLAYGGTEAVLDNLARGLQAAGQDVLLFATGDSTCDVPTRWVRPTAVGTVGASTATELHHVINAYAAVVEWGADIVHDHTVAGPVFAAHYDIPIVTTNHRPFEGELADLYRALAGTVPVIALSEHHARTAGDIPVAATIHHGLDVDAFPQGNGDGGYAAFVGRMCPEKGVLVAIRVARTAGVPLRVAAKMREPAEIAYFERQVEPMLGGAVEYLGEVGGRDKRDLLAGATCLLNPLAWAEPFGMVMIEALACGTPVVATPCGTAPELVTHGVTGFICSGEQELVDALGHVDRLDRSRCRKDAAERFSTARMVADHLDFYRSHLAAYRARHRQAREPLTPAR